MKATFPPCHSGTASGRRPPRREIKPAFDDLAPIPCESVGFFRRVIDGIRRRFVRVPPIVPAFDPGKVRVESFGARQMLEGYFAQAQRAMQEASRSGGIDDELRSHR